MKILIHEDDRIVKILATTTLNDAKEFLVGKKFLVLEDTSAYVGLDVRAVKEDGSLLSLSEQAERGFYIIPEGFEIIDDTLVAIKSVPEPEPELPIEVQEEQEFEHLMMQAIDEFHKQQVLQNPAFEIFLENKFREATHD